MPLSPSGAPKDGFEPQQIVPTFKLQPKRSAVPQPATDLVNRLRIPAYIVTAYMAVGSLIDIGATTWPPLTHDLRWRLAIESFSTGASGTVLLAVLVFLAFAWAAANRLALGIGFAYCAIVGVGYLAESVSFALDSLQIKGQVAAEQLSRYNVGMVWTMSRLLFTGVALLYLAIVAIRAFRRLGETERGVAAGPGAILVGRPAPAADRVKV